MYLADSGMNKYVSSIASVSGGSVTNGFIAQEVDFTEVNGDEFEEKVAKPLAQGISFKRKWNKLFMYLWLAVLFVCLTASRIHLSSIDNYSLISLSLL